MTAAALTHGYGTDTTLPCSSAFRVGNRDFHNHESAAYGNITFARRSRSPATPSSTASATTTGSSSAPTPTT